MDLRSAQSGRMTAFATRRAVVGVVMATVLAVAAVGCGSSSGGSSNGGGSGGSQSKVAPKIAYLTYAQTAYVTAEENGLKKAIAPLGGSYDLFNANYDPQKQLKQCQDAITSSRYNALLIAAVDGSAIAPCIAQAKAANIPVVAIEIPIGPNRDAVAPQVDGVVGSVVYTGLDHGKLLAPFVDKACAGLPTCNVIVEVDSLSDPYAAEWLKYLKANKGSNVNIVKVMEGQYDNTVTAKNMPDALLANPDTNVAVLESDDNALAAVPALKKLNMQDKVKLIGDGGSQIGVKGIKDGTLYGTFANWPFQYGTNAGQMLNAAVNKEAIKQNAINALTMNEPQLITKDNVNQFTPEWQ